MDTAKSTQLLLLNKNIYIVGSATSPSACYRILFWTNLIYPLYFFKAQGLKN